MTSLLNIAGNIPVSGVVAGQSLRFEDGDSAYLSWTPASAGNRKTWTWSGWAKRANVASGSYYLLGVSVGTSQWFFLGFTNAGNLDVRQFNSSSYDFRKISTAIYRDPSSWYHIVMSYESGNATAEDRIKLYVNGERVTSFSTNSNPSSGLDAYVSQTNKHVIGAFSDNNGSSISSFFDGYLANVCFIDGQALDPTSFGEYQDTLWKPKSDADITSLTFGTNGFYLPFKQTTEAEGFSTVTYTGNGGTQSIEGVGFEPDFVWIKNRDTGYHHQGYDSVRGATKKLLLSSTDAEATDTNGLTSFDSSGFSLGSNVGVNESGKKHVAWCWDAGSGSPVSNTDGSITSTVKANTAKGFSIVSYTGTKVNATVGHGLSSPLDLLIIKNRTGTLSWPVYHSSLGGLRYMLLDGSGASLIATSVWNSTDPTSSVFSLGTSNYNNASGGNFIAYCFHSVSGYSSFGSYTGTGAAGNSITGLGFKPAWIMIKKTNAAEDWAIYDNTRSPVNTVNKLLTANTSDAEATPSANVLDFDSDGFTIQGSGNTINTSGGTYIYLAFADTRDATFFGDTSGNGNNWTPNALNNTDVVPDSPVAGGNFATLNPLDKDGHVNSEGNLKVSGNVIYGHQGGTFAVTSGKWYFEAILTVQQNDTAIGLKNQDADTDAHYTGQTTDSVGYLSDGRFFYNGSSTSYSSYSTGDVAQIAFDADTGEIWIGKNNTWQNSGDPAAGTGEVQTVTWDEFVPAARTVSTGAIVFNFGQDSSFAGTKTPQGNTDDNGVGDFYYAPPSGFLALTTGNLDTPAITAPDEYHGTLLFTGNGSTQSITGLGWQPDFTWIKMRSDGTRGHALFDAVRGGTERLDSSSTQEGRTNEGNISFDADGFSVTSSHPTVNDSSDSAVAWNWLASNSTVSNTSGSITSTVSANQTAGFSVVSYTGNGTDGATIGHGLGTTPSMVICKRRDTAQNWVVAHSGITLASQSLALNLTTQATSFGDGWIDAWDSTTFTANQGSASIVNVNANTGTYIAYCFAEVEGYSKIGSYTGNGSTDGTFVHTGFAPALVIYKDTNAANNWEMVDRARDTYNVANKRLFPSSSSAESTSVNTIDFLSNGFKLRGTHAGANVSGINYIYIAFAEAPFKSANAR